MHIAAGLLARHEVSDLDDESLGSRTAFANAWKGTSALVQDWHHSYHLAALVIGIAMPAYAVQQISTAITY